MKTSKSRRRKISLSRNESSNEGKKWKKRPRHEHFLEYVEWLDQKGKPLAIVDRTLAHRYGLYHPVVHVWIIDSHNRFIAQKRGRKMKLFPLHWDSSAAGHYRFNETKERGAQRELKEELGFITKLRYLGFVNIRGTQKEGPYYERVHFFLGKTNQQPNAQKYEIEALKRIPLDQMNDFVRHVKFAPTFLGGWKKLGKRLIQKAKWGK